MAAFPEMFTQGGFIDAVLALVAVEALVLVAVHARTGRGIAPASLLATLAAGAFLLVALRSALIGAGAAWIAGSLLAAGVAHCADLALRWRR